MILRKTVGKDQGGLRLDDAIAVLCGGVSKSEARRIIDRGGCTVNVALVRVASRSVKAGDVIEIGVMEAGRFQELRLPPEALLYEDAELIAVNKPAGINSQRTPYQLKGTLEYWVTEYFKSQGNSEPARVVHRLDRGTSGVMIFPKNRQAAAWLSKQFQDGLVDKTYLALVCGRPEQDEWTVDGPIGKIASARYGIVEGGKQAATGFRTVATSGDLSLVEARPLTGRTHQIRVHLESAGLPILGDATYGGQAAGRMMLHCSAMTFKNSKGVEITVTAPLDGEFAERVRELRTRSCCSGLLSCFLGSLAYLFLLLLLPVVDPAAAIAGELFGLYGVTNKIDSPYHSFAYQVEYREGLGENFAASASYLNEGHLPNHHRDGLAPITLWGRVNVLDRRLSLAVGAGPYLYADTTVINGVAKDDHDVGGIMSASATLYTKSRLLLQGRVNWVAIGRSMDTFTALVGLGYQLDPPLSPGPLPTPPRQRERTTDNELSVYAGQTVVNNPGSPKSVATCIEYRRGLLRHLDVSAAWLNEGNNDLIRRNGALAQFWLVRAFLDDKLSLGGGFGGYFAIDKRKVTNSDQGGTGFASGVISVTASVRDFGFNPDLSLRFIMNRIVTNYDKDTDIFLLGLGYRF